MQAIKVTTQRGCETDHNLNHKLHVATEALRQIELVSESEYGNHPETKLRDIAKRCRTDLANIESYPLPTGRTK